jgi:hypothetical protein
MRRQYTSLTGKQFLAAMHCATWLSKKIQAGETVPLEKLQEIIVYKDGDQYIFEAKFLKETSE